MSCPSAGNCAAGGFYRGRGFVVSERDGVWGRVIEVPGLRALGANAYVSSVSCASPGNCVAGGNHGWPYAWGFVVSEKHGVWGRAINVPGLVALTDGRTADVLSISCARAGNCAAGGNYEDMAHGGSQGFVAVERNGIWGRAIEMPGLGALNKGGGAAVFSVSCAPPGNCAAGGFYGDSPQHFEGFVS